MSKAWPIVLLASASCQLGTLVDPAPFDARNQHPVQLTGGQLAPRAARAVSPGAAELLVKVDWTNLWLRHGAGVDRLETDGELVRLAPRLRVGLGADLDLAVELPIMHAAGGVLDRLIELWHDLGGFVDGHRELFPRNRFKVSFERRQPDASLVSAYQMQARPISLGDLPVELGWFPIDDGPWRAGLRAGVELPTGDEAAGLGNGKFDAMLGAAASWHEGPLAIFGWGGWSWVGTAARAQRAGMDYIDVASGGIGGEVAVGQHVSALVQVNWEHSLLERLDDTHANRSQGFLWAGARIRLANGAHVEIALGEDVIRGLSPDVTFHAALRLSW